MNQAEISRLEFSADFGLIRENWIAVDGLWRPETKGRKVKHRPLNGGQAPCAEAHVSGNSVRVTSSARTSATLPPEESEESRKIDCPLFLSRVVGSIPTTEIYLHPEKLWTVTLAD